MDHFEQQEEPQQQQEEPQHQQEQPQQQQEQPQQQQEQQEHHHHINFAFPPMSFPLQQNNFAFPPFFGQQQGGASPHVHVAFGTLPMSADPDALHQHIQQIQQSILQQAGGQEANFVGGLVLPVTAEIEGLEQQGLNNIINMLPQLIANGLPNATAISFNSGGGMLPMMLPRRSEGIAAATHVVERLGYVLVKPGDQAECTVCQEMYCVNEIVRRMPCGHQFHGPCLIPWLRRSNRCPTCRCELETNDEAYNRSHRDQFRQPQSVCESSLQAPVDCGFSALNGVSCRLDAEVRMFKLPGCGCIVHLACLQSWMSLINVKTLQICPMCKTNGIIDVNALLGQNQAEEVDHTQQQQGAMSTQEASQGQQDKDEEDLDAMLESALQEIEQ